MSRNEQQCNRAIGLLADCWAAERPLRSNKREVIATFLIPNDYKFGFRIYRNPRLSSRLVAAFIEIAKPIFKLRKVCVQKQDIMTDKIFMMKISQEIKMIHKLSLKQIGIRISHSRYTHTHT